MSDSLLEVRGLDIVYGSGRRANHVLHQVSVDIRPGETLGLVGESGSGKTTLGRAVLGLVPVAAGTVRFDGEDITRATARRRRMLARSMQAVFQDPYSSLNPAMTIEEILSEPLVAQGTRAREARAHVRGLLDQVGMPADASRRYAREFSGGQRQRVAIARALALDPRLIVCDEPVSALDLSTQERVLELLIDIQSTSGVSYLFVSHDLAVVRFISHRVAVMLKGEIVEEGVAAEVTDAPRHPYTQRLLMANLVADPDEQAERRSARRELARHQRP